MLRPTTVVTGEPTHRTLSEKKLALMAKVMNLETDTIVTSLDETLNLFLTPLREPLGNNDRPLLLSDPSPSMIVKREFREQNELDESDEEEEQNTRRTNSNDISDDELRVFYNNNWMGSQQSFVDTYKGCSRSTFGTWLTKKSNSPLARKIAFKYYQAMVNSLSRADSDSSDSESTTSTSSMSSTSSSQTSLSGNSNSSFKAELTRNARKHTQINTFKLILAKMIRSSDVLKKDLKNITTVSMSPIGLVANKAFASKPASLGAVTVKDLLKEPSILRNDYSPFLDCPYYKKVVGVMKKYSTGKDLKFAEVPSSGYSVYVAIVRIVRNNTEEFFVYIGDTTRSVRTRWVEDHLSLIRKAISGENEKRKYLAMAAARSQNILVFFVSDSLTEHFVAKEILGENYLKDEHCLNEKSCNNIIPERQ